MARPKQTGMKREREIKKQTRKKEKEERKTQRKSDSNKGKGLESMMAYVDENGQLSDTPPDPSRKKEVKAENMRIGAEVETEDKTKDYTNEGKITYYNDEKGYGFIKDARTGESVFFHMNDLLAPIKLYDTVSFLKVKGQRGIQAAEVKPV